jgi:hypothetical protein
MGSLAPQTFIHKWDNWELRDADKFLKSCVLTAWRKRSAPSFLGLAWVSEIPLSKVAGDEWAVHSRLGDGGGERKSCRRTGFVISSWNSQTFPVECAAVNLGYLIGAWGGGTGGRCRRPPLLLR